MLKKILIIFFIMFNFVNAEIVENLNIFGNDRISSETIKVYGEIEVGKDYSNEDLNLILKNLFSTDFFENVSLNLNNGTLNINVKEYPVIYQIDLRGEKSNNIKDLILSRIQLKPKGSFISTKLNDDINLIKNLYSSLGYNFAKVDSKIEKFSENRLNILFDINPGNRTYIKKIDFIGDKKIRDNKLRDIIVSEEYKFWKFLTKNVYFNQANIDLDRRLLLNYYKSIGYYDVQVLSNSAEIDENNFSNLVFSINAGKRYKISKISANIDSVISKDAFLGLQDSFIEYTGKFYSPFKIQKILESVDQVISNNDLQFVEHSVNEIIGDDKIEIVINIYEGKKSLVEKVNIFGNNVTEESVIRSALLLDEGDPFNNLKLEKSLAKLKARNIFGNIKSSTSDGSKKEQKIINIEVEEKPTGEISAGAGIGTNGGSFIFSVSENNWLGKGINISSDLDVSSESFSGGLSVTDPNFNYSGNSLNYFVKNIKNDQPNSGYKDNIFTTGIGVQFEQYRDIFLSPRIVFSYDDLKVQSSASSALQSQKGTFTDITFDYGIYSDKRDRAYGPTDGYTVNFSQAFPIYADSPFIRNTLTYNKYNNLTPNLLTAMKFYASSITGLNDKDVRISKRLKPGSRLRGFERGKVGPKDGEDFVGGNYVTVVNLEMNLPNLLPESTKTDVGFFLDFGNVWHVDYNDLVDNSNKIRSTVGINSNWQSPVGPMSFIFSKNISKASTDITESFNFRLGTTF